MKTLLLVLSIGLCGCIHMRPAKVSGAVMARPPLPPEKCEELDSRVLSLNVTSVIFGAASSGAATATSIFDQPVARYTLAGGAALFSLAGVVTGYFSTYYAKQYADRCPQ